MNEELKNTINKSSEMIKKVRDEKRELTSEEEKQIEILHQQAEKLLAMMNK